ncbi:MAG TPA: bifunctional pyr operon transcriptional regulator/uracil phosphoribosyltransferase PyrR [Candidatus Goldiibacteriota bacterium]|nr:bifunctional pyr operon transcriptional regulator/uracil phosphoribosyltransferase PyrR [Candidatus Goldiibacteriota bacterium]
MEKKLKIKSELLDKTSISRALTRISHEIIEKNHGAKNLAIVGIKSRGDVLARRIADNIKSIENTEVPIGAVDITLYRDDYDRISKVEVKSTELPFSVDDRDIVLVDDVLYTGRSTRAAMDVVMDYGRPKTIQLAVLVDRGHRELPIQANYVGKNVPTSKNEIIVLKLEEPDGGEKVLLAEKEG